MAEKNYNIFSKMNGQSVNFVTNKSSKIYKDNILVSDIPIGDFSRYIDAIDCGFYIENGVCVFTGVDYFIESNYLVKTSTLGDSIVIDSGNKTCISMTPYHDYNTITVVLELTGYFNYLFFVWNDMWDILFKEEVDVPGQAWAGILSKGYYVLYVDDVSPPPITIVSNGIPSVYTESFIVFYAEGNTTITFGGSSGTITTYLRSLDNNETFVKTTSEGMYIYSKTTELGPFKVPINTVCVFDFEYFINGSNTEVYIYCNYFLVGRGSLVDFSLSSNKQIAFNLTTVNVKTTLVSSNIYNFGLFNSSVPCPASVYDICSRSISSPVQYTNIYDDDNLYVYKTDYSVWVLDYYNDTVMVLYGDELKKSTITSLYNNLLYDHNYYSTTSYGFSLDRYKIVDYLYNNGVFILLLEDRLVIIDKFGTVLRYIYCKNISRLFYIDNYVLFYDKTRARLYRVYSSDFRSFEFPSIVMNIDFSTKFKVCQPVDFGPFHVVNGDYVSVVKEQSIFGYKALYDYSSIRTYTIDSSEFSNLVFEYDITQRATLFTGITTSLGYRLFANNPIEQGLTSFTLFISIKPMSTQFKRYLVRIPGVLDVYMVDGLLTVELKCENTDIVVECTRVFNINVWYDIYVTYNSSNGVYVYVGNLLYGYIEFDYDTGGTKGQKYVIIGGYGADAYAAYKFDGFIRDEIFMSRSFITKEKAVDLANNNVRDSKTFSEFNTYVSAYGVTNIVCNNNYMFVGTYDGLYVYETSTFKLVKLIGPGNIVLGMELKGSCLYANIIRIPPIGSIAGSADTVVKISGEYKGYLFMSGNVACNTCIYKGNTYVGMLSKTVDVINISNYFGNDVPHGYYNLGKMSIDQLNTEIQCVSEFGYDEQSGNIVGDNYTNSTLAFKLIDCCDDVFGGATVYAESFTSAILYEEPNKKPNYDVFIGVSYTSENLLSMNLFDIALDLEYVVEYAPYRFLIDRLNAVRMPYENFIAVSSESINAFLGIYPTRLYHSEDSMVGSTNLNLYFEASESNLKLLKTRTLKVLENYIKTNYRFAYDFRGGMGNGVTHKIEHETCFGVLDGTSYFLNNSFNDFTENSDNVWRFSAEFILRVNNHYTFNPIFSKSNKSDLSYSMAICDENLKFLFGQNGVISVVDLEVSINVNQWVFVAIYLDDTYIDVFVNGIYKRVKFYGLPDVVESEMYVGFGIYLNKRASNFIGDMLYFDIDSGGSIDKIYTDYAIYTGSKSETFTYDEIINLNEYYNIEETIFKLTSAFYQSPDSRNFKLYDFYMIGSDENKTVTAIDGSSIFSSSLLRRGLNVDTVTLDYDLKSFSECSDFSYDDVGGLYSVTTGDTIEYTTDIINNINKLDSVTTIKYTDSFTLVGTFGGLIKINNILSNNSTKQKWIIDNGVTSLLITDEYVYIASGKELSFVQVDYLKKETGDIIVRNPLLIYTSRHLIESIVRYDDKTCILSGNEIINATDGNTICACGDVRMLFGYDDDVLMVYKNSIKKLSNDEVILETRSKITDISYGDTLAVSTSSGFYVFDDVDGFVFNSIGITGILSNCDVMPDYCYHVCIVNNSLIYIYRDIDGIKLIEFNTDTKKIINNVVLFTLVDGSFSDNIPYTFDSVGR